MILYLHGFRSSPQSYKARLLAQAMAERNLAEQWLCPQLPASPAAAIAMANQLIEQAQARGVDIGRDLVVIGSSLGGYYASHLAEHWKCRAVVLNPAVYAASSLSAQVGEHTQYHSDAAFTFLTEYIDELKAIAPPMPTHPERYFLLACKGDEVLNWQDMANWYSGSQGRILEGGDHGISDFERWLPDVLEFALTTPPVPTSH